MIKKLSPSIIRLHRSRPHTGASTEPQVLVWARPSLWRVPVTLRVLRRGGDRHVHRISVGAAGRVRQSTRLSEFPSSIGSHGAGKTVAVRTGQVDGDRKSNAIFMEKRPKRGQPHCLVVFEHGVQSDDSDVREECCDALSLWKAMRDASGGRAFERHVAAQPVPLGLTG